MVIYHLKDLMLKKSVATRKRITYAEIANEIGVSRITLSRMASTRGHSISMDIIEKLCDYFECEINNLISFVPDPPESAPPKVGKPAEHPAAAECEPAKGA